MFCLHFIVCNIKKKKIQNSNFEFQFKIQNSKLKKKRRTICGIYILMSRDRAKPSSYWVEIRNFDSRSLTYDDVSPSLYSLLLTSADPKKKMSFYFPLYAFLFYLQYSKKKFKFWISKLEKKNLRTLALTSKKEKKKFKFRNSNFKIQTSKKKKKGKPFVGYIFFDEPRSSQAIEPLSWDPEPRPF